MGKPKKTQKYEARAIYKKINEEYVNIFTEEERRIATKLQSALHNSYNPNFENIIRQILTEENQPIEILSKIAPLILVREEERTGETIQLTPENISRYDLLKELLEKKLIDPNYLFSNGSTLFHILAVLDKHEIEDLLKLAIEHGYDVNKKDKNGNTILHLAISCPYRARNLKNFLYALDKNFNYSTTNNDGYDIFEYYDHILKNINENNPKNSNWRWYLYRLDNDDSDYIHTSGHFQNIVNHILGTNLIEELNKINFKVNRLHKFLSIFGSKYTEYKTNEKDSNQELRNQINARNKEYNQRKETVLDILKECFFNFADDIFKFIIDNELTPTFSIIYTNLLAIHHEQINKDYLSLPPTSNKLFLTFIELFKLEYGCNKEIGANIPRILKVTEQ